MKKEYISPSMKAYNAKPSQIICGSGGERGKLSTSSDPEDAPTATETDWGTGIWGE